MESRQCSNLMACSENPMEIQWKLAISEGGVGAGVSVPMNPAVGLTRKDCNIRESDGNLMEIRDS